VGLELEEERLPQRIRLARRKEPSAPRNEGAQ